jgi:hypothetical protein
MLLANAGTAEAHWFEPQPHWWTSGRLCAASRNPPARRWQALPPRSCGSARMRQVTINTVSMTSAAIVGKQEFAEPKEPVAEEILAVVARSDEVDLPRAD